MSLVSFGQAVVEISGAAGHHADPKVLFAALGELAQFLRQRVAGLASIPPGTAGGFLQPPQSQFDRRPFGAEG